jgi:hypothetical protein
MTPARGNAEYKKKCAAVKRLEAEVSAAHVALDNALSNLVQIRTLRGKKPLTQKISFLTQKYEKVGAEHAEMAKEKEDYEKGLEQMRTALEESNEMALQREREKAHEKHATETSQLEDYIVTLARQLKASEALGGNGPSTSTPCPAILEPTLSPTPASNIAPALVSGATVPVDVFTPSPTPNIDNSASIQVRPSSMNDATAVGDSYEYIDARDADCALIHKIYLTTYKYILSRTDENLSNLQELVDQPYMCRWPKEWTNKIEALRKFMCVGWEEDVRMMNCIKMYGLSKAEDGSLLVRDHRSKGEPCIFWTHNCHTAAEHTWNWNIGRGSAFDVPGLVLKVPGALGDVNTVSTRSTSLQALASTKSQHAGNIVDPSVNVLRDVLQECMGIVDVSDHTQLLEALKNIKIANKKSIKL